MQISERELWILNFYRNSELHGALLMGRLARTLPSNDLLLQATRHCATEAHHAALLSEAIVAVGGRLDPTIKPVQEHYSAAGGIPKALADLLVLSETLEQRVLTTYRAHLERTDLHLTVRRTIAGILEEMEHEHGDEHAGWIDRALSELPRAEVEAVEARWRAVDRTVADELARALDERFPRT
jgi:bacterioferritin (cytochrome b1)